MYSCRSCGVEDIVVDGRREKKRGSFGWMCVRRASPPRRAVAVGRERGASEKGCAAGKDGRAREME